MPAGPERVWIRGTCCTKKYLGWGGRSIDYECFILTAYQISHESRVEFSVRRQMPNNGIQIKSKPANHFRIPRSRQGSWNVWKVHENWRAAVRSLHRRSQYRGRHLPIMVPVSITPVFCPRGDPFVTGNGTAPSDWLVVTPPSRAATALSLSSTPSTPPLPLLLLSSSSPFPSLVLPFVLSYTPLSPSLFFLPLTSTSLLRLFHHALLICSSAPPVCSPGR